MNNITEIIRKKAQTLLENKEVDAVLGFSRGTLPMVRRPFLARTHEQAEHLCWDSFCLMNLAKFIPTDFEGKIAVTAKGCDWRNLVVHHQEGRLNLNDQVVVLGIACEGMLDPEKISLAAGGIERVFDVACDDGEVRVQTVDGELELKKETLYRQACLECIQSSPLKADHWISKPAGAMPLHGCSDTLHLFGSDDPENRQNQLRDMFKHCLMCFACRDACPLCYCNHCFVDVEKTHWLSTQSSLDNILDFHFFRAHHIAGRCTDCGACESACPMNIPVRQLVKKLNADIEKSTGYIPGIETEIEPPMGTFRPSYHESERR
jgi:formate dehydrogenase (coenzyme F420) beta subunit